MTNDTKQASEVRIGDIVGVNLSDLGKQVGLADDQWDTFKEHDR